MPGQQSQSKHQHRATGLRQSNKKNKRSRASKRSRAVRAGGKVAESIKATTTTSSSSSSCLASQSKANRRNHQQQIRDAKRQAILRQRRGLGGTGSSSIQKQQPLATPPRLVGIVGLSAHPAALEGRVRDYLMGHASRVIRHQDGGIAAVSCQYDAHKKESGGGALTLRTASSLTKNEDDNNEDATLWAVLDLARVCDTLVFVVDGDQYSSSSQQHSSSSVTTISGAHAADFVVGMEIGGDDQEHDNVKSNNKTSHITFQQQQQERLDHLITERADRWLSALKAQGLPTPLTVLAASMVDGDDDDDQKTMQSVKSVRRSKLKRQLELQRWVRRMATTEFGPNHDKVLEVDLSIQQPSSGNNDNSITTATTTTGNNSSSSSNLIRTLCTMSCTPAQWVSQLPRAYLVADSVAYDATTRQLQLLGHVRGRAPWNVNALVHVPQIGTVACRSVARATAPLTALVQQSRKNNHNNPTKSSMITTPTSESEPQDWTVLADPTQRESLHMYASPDGLEGEQNLIGFESDDEGGEDDDVVAPLVPRPAGWSDYQSAWLDAVDGNDTDNQHGGQDTGELAQELNRRKVQVDASLSVAGTTLGDDPMMDMEQANHVSETERRALWQERRQKQQSEETEFPDEVQVDEDVKARDRFARYRSLASFRKSHWDPKENLPDSYASIYHLASFTQTQRSVMKEMKALIREANAVEGNFWGKSLSSANNNDNKPSTTTVEDVEMEVESGDDEEEEEEEEDFLEGCIPSGSYVALTLENVSPEAMSALAPNALLTAVTLLSHENKVSVLHMGLSQTAGCNATTKDPVKSKDLLTFRCGWRTWQARPVFSQNNLNCDKHKFERFLPTSGAFFAASVFGPITYTPCPVLVFRETQNLNNDCNSSSRCQLVAVGSMLGANADRIVVKRIVLTGYPVRVHKRHATVKYMFYDPEDVKWFKPAGLYTKHGLQGNIQQSVGEHGTMKCLFNAPIQQHDTVCLPLYKRIYPKYAEPIDSDIVEREVNIGSGGTVPGGTLVDQQSRRKATNLVVR